MVLKVILPILAICGIALGVFMVYQGTREPTPAEPITRPAQVPYDSFLAGSGIIESGSSEIKVGAQLSGIADKIEVDVGDKVKKGAVLVVLDVRHLEAEKSMNLYDLEIAKAQVKQSQANLGDRKSQLALAEKIKDKRAISVDELDRRRYAVEVAQAGLDVANARVKKARSELKKTDVDIDRMTIKAPITGEVLQVNIDPGERVTTDVTVKPLIVMGDSDQLRVRVDIDEHDAWRFVRGTEAIGVLRGNTSITIPLKYQKTEPLVVPRTQLSGDTSQAIDQRVLQVLFTFDKTDLPVYIGQQVDVWIETPKSYNGEPHPTDEEE